MEEMQGLDMLIKKCQQKNVKAFDELYKKFAPMVYGICLRYTKNIEEAKDLMQDNFIKILEKIDEYQFKGSFEGWIRKTTINNAINYLKINKKYFSGEIENVESDEKFTENTYVEKMNAKELIKIINKLPSGYRTIFNLFAIEGFTHAEIADMLEIDASTSRTQFKKAKKAIINLLKQENYERF